MSTLAGAVWLLAALQSTPVVAQAVGIPSATVGPDRAFAYEASSGSRLLDVPLRSSTADGREPLASGGYGVADPSATSGAPLPVPIPSNAPGSEFGGIATDRTACWTWQLLPDGLLYPAYLAGVRESRMGTQFVHVDGHGWFWDFTTGGHMGLLRCGSEDNRRPDGWQLDVEAAAFPRLGMEAGGELRSCDFRGGVPLTCRRGPWEGKFGYYHLCAHLGDLFVLEHPSFPRITYVRDCLVLGAALRPWRDVRLYCEVGYAVQINGLAKQWEFQFGTEYSAVEPTGFRGAPFLAVNGHLRQENDFGGNVSLQTGWQWRGQTGHLIRVGLHYFNGLSEQHQFFSTYENQLGAGLWYDF